MVPQGGAQELQAMMVRVVWQLPLSALGGITSLSILSSALFQSRVCISCPFEAVPPCYHCCSQALTSKYLYGWAGQPCLSRPNQEQGKPALHWCSCLHKFAAFLPCPPHPPSHCFVCCLEPLTLPSKAAVMLLMQQTLAFEPVLV